jgi:hypothetical protein
MTIDKKKKAFLNLPYYPYFVPTTYIYSELSIKGFDISKLILLVIYVYIYYIFKWLKRTKMSINHVKSFICCTFVR